MTKIAIPDCFERTPSLEKLLDWCTKNDIQVQFDFVFININLRAGYSYSKQTIYISKSLPSAWVVPTLAHEIIHAYNDHDGHQSRATENRIDEAVAKVFINPAEYAYWENQYGWRTGGIAKALDMPRWVVEAYRRLLTKQLRNTLERNPYGIDIVA